MATNLGAAYVQIMPSAKGISGSISNVLNSEADSAGKSSGLNIASAIKGAIAAAGIGEVLKSALTAGGDLQQSFGGLDTLYGEAAEGAKRYAQEASAAGISANDYAEQAVSFGAALKAAYGGDTTKAMEAANTAIMDMADNSAKMGTDIGSVQMAYQGFAKQNYTMLDNLKLGYGGTKEEMQRLLADATKLSGVEYNIDNLGDVYDAIHVMQGELGLTGVAADEAKTTFSGSFGAMKAAATNFLASLSLGENVGPSLTTLLTAVGTFLKDNLLPMVLNIVTSLPQVLTTALDTVGPQIMEAVNLIPKILDTITANLPDLLTKGVEIITNLANGFLQGIPTAITNFGQIMTKIFNFLLTNGPLILNKGVELIGNLARGFINNLPAIVGAMTKVAANMLNTLIKHLPQILQTGKNIITKLVTGITEFMPKVPALLKKIATIAMDNFKEVDWKGLGTTVIDFLKDSISSVGSSIWELLKEIGTTAYDKFKEIDWLELGSTVITFVVDGLSSLFSNIGDTLLDIGESAWDMFSNIDWLGLGSDIVNGIIDGVWNVASDLWDTMTSLASSALETAENWLGIGSPSKVFRDSVGKWIPLGIAEGIDDEAGAVTGAVKGIAEDSVNAFDTGAVRATPVDGDLGNAPGNITIPINVYASEGMDVVQLANKVSDVLSLQMRQTRSAWGLA